jgi:hypothetical protein
MGDLRQTGRYQFTGKLMLSWLDREGNACSGPAECVDISEGGMRVRTKIPLDVRAYVTVKFPNANLHGAASVRSCVRERMNFVAGLQFTGGMKVAAEFAEAVGNLVTS